jgi:hypothetical protein
MSTHGVDRDAAHEAILDHAPALRQSELGPIRIRLVAEHFGPSVTHVVMWLRDYGLDIGCTEITVRRHPDGNALLSSRRLLPPPAAEDYLVKRRKRDVEEVTREVTTRRRNSVTILLEAGALEPGETVRLKIDWFVEAREALERIIANEPLFGEAEWTGISLNQALRWRRDGELYACTRLVLKMLEEVGYPTVSVPGPQCWVIADGRALSDLALEIEPRRTPVGNTVGLLALLDFSHCWRRAS